MNTIEIIGNAPLDYVNLFVVKRYFGPQDIIMWHRFFNVFYKFCRYLLIVVENLWTSDIMDILNYGSEMNFISNINRPDTSWRSSFIMAT